MLRLIAMALMLVPGSAAAWEARIGVVCALVRDDPAGFVRLTYDPSIPEYAIAITLERPWTAGPVFAMRFDGPRGATISTQRHVLSDGGATLTVTDRGFGNVLDGLEFNQTATALIGDDAVAFPLEDAAPAVRAFRECALGLNA